MLTNIITKKSILSKFEIVTISTIFRSQKAVKARIIANALHFSLLILKKIFSWIFFLQKASEICAFPEKVRFWCFVTKKSKNVCKWHNSNILAVFPVFHVCQYIQKTPIFAKSPFFHSFFDFFLQSGLFSGFVEFSH